MSAVLRSLVLLSATNRRHGAGADFATLRAMLFYIDEFPERRHHVKESKLLFPKVRARLPSACDLLDRLDEDHARGERRIRDLQRALLAFEVMGETRRGDFQAAVRDYVAFHFEHMALEEREVLPMAERALTAADWDALDAAFGADRDPLTGGRRDAEYQQIFTRIFNALPAPIGLAAG